ncbi:type VI secretion system Vgr family protein [Aquimarina aquimarini]|uniref:type VI secretion system Vgr family protein n=2 Tax=Aquimarina aquimarini TaxID=1191734 RepID=UPI001F29C642|nr:phage baseplate assembly protein V [Aquimarina aquimarini]
MALQTTTTIYIANKQLSSYKMLQLHQEIDAHHSLELVCRTDALEQISDELIGESKEYIGSIITIQVSANSIVDSYRELEFKGVVTGVETVKGFEESQGDLICIKAKSASILADNFPHYASYSEVGLSDILQDTFQGYDLGKLETNFSPTNSSTIHYSVQHNESDFAYASRLSAYYNQWFYYDGKQLIFGSPSTEEIELSYGIDLKKFSINMEPMPNNASYFTNDFLTNTVHQKSSSEVNIPSEGYHGFADSKSRELYNKQTRVYNPLYTDATMKPRLDAQVEAYTKSRAIQQIIAKGGSDNPGVCLGQIIRINGHGSYRVTKIVHTNVEGGVYKNEFEAVDANFDAYPKMDIYRFPKSETQTATVVENSDPDGLGRIKVQFAWQKPLGERTPWLRMMTPHAGADKGFHFIPEINEEVMVGFEGGNAERPFVLGALYNGSKNPSSWQSQNNDIKAIRTKSQHTITLDDSNGAEMITITDKNNNIIRIDTANNNIEISALENMTLNAKNMQINVQENLDVSVGENKNESIGKNQTLTAKNSTILIEETAEFQSKELEKNAERIVMNSTKENMELSSSKQLVSNSSEKNILI